MNIPPQILNKSVPSPTAESDFLAAAGSPLAWAKKTLAEIKTILGIVLTFAAQSVGFTISGGTTSKTLTVDEGATISALNKGAAKAWVNFNGTGTVAIRESYNVTSITDGGTGIYTVNLTNSLADTKYAVIANATNDSASVGNPFIINYSRTVNSFVLNCIIADSSATDRDTIQAAAFR